MTKQQYITATIAAIGFFIILGTFGAMELDRISWFVFWRQLGIGFGVCMVAAVIGRL